jgi:hypothetical protein
MQGDQIQSKVISLDFCLVAPLLVTLHPLNATKDT